MNIIKKKKHQNKCGKHINLIFHLIFNHKAEFYEPFMILSFDLYAKHVYIYMLHMRSTTINVEKDNLIMSSRYLIFLDQFFFKVVHLYQTFYKVLDILSFDLYALRVYIYARYV